MKYNELPKQIIKNGITFDLIKKEIAKDVLSLYPNSNRFQIFYLYDAENDKGIPIGKTKDGKRFQLSADGQTEKEAYDNLLEKLNSLKEILYANADDFYRKVIKK